MRSDYAVLKLLLFWEQRAFLIEYKNFKIYTK